MQHGYYIEDIKSGSIRFTQPGAAFLAPRLSALGIDIHAIRTRARFDVALDALYEHEIRRVAKKARGMHPDLDRILAAPPQRD